jgi:DNA-binding NarL/FixJ family response regulator
MKNLLDNRPEIASGQTQALAEFGAKVLTATFTDESSLTETVETYGALLSTALYRIARATAADPNPAGQLPARRRSNGILSRLSPREGDVLALMAEGLGNAAIADQLFITEGGVHKHIRSIFAKLDLAPADRVDRRVTAVLYYLNTTASAGVAAVPASGADVIPA